MLTTVWFVRKIALSFKLWVVEVDNLLPLERLISNHLSGLFLKGLEVFERPRRLAIAVESSWSRVFFITLVCVNGILIGELASWTAVRVAGLWGSYCQV